MPLRHAIILWVSGTLTAFLLVGIFWTVFRNELDAARDMAGKATASLEQTDGLLRKTTKMSERLEQHFTGLDEAREEFLRETRRGAHAINEDWMAQLLESARAIQQEVSREATDRLVELKRTVDSGRSESVQRLDELTRLVQELTALISAKDLEAHRRFDALRGEVEALAEQVRLLRERLEEREPSGAPGS